MPAPNFWMRWRTLGCDVRVDVSVDVRVDVRVDACMCGGGGGGMRYGEGGVLVSIASVMFGCQ